MTLNLRAQLPVYSPLPLRAIVTGVRGLASSRLSGRDRLTAWLSDRFRTDHIVLTDSGTSALTLALRGAMRRNPSGAVALPAYGCYDLATAADGADGRVLLYDVDPLTLQPDEASLHALGKQDLAAVVIVHLFGIPVDPSNVRALVAGSGALVIDDAAQGIGGSVGGAPLGALGALGILSFGRGKGMTGGSGGALLGFGESGAPVVGEALGTIGNPSQGFRSLASLLGQWALGRPGLYGVPSSLPFLGLGETAYRSPQPASGLTPFASGVLAITTSSALPEASARRRVADLLGKRMEGAPSLRPIGSRVGIAGYLRLPVLASSAARRAAGEARARRLGIMPGYPKALCDLGGFTDRCLNATHDFPGARQLARQLITLPTHSLLRDADLNALTSWIATYRS